MNKSVDKPCETGRVSLSTPQGACARVVLVNESMSEQWACRLARVLCAPMMITWRGEIGAGKTTMVRALLRALGVQSAIKSPTFSLIESYETTNFVLHHADLYRIHEATELDDMGFRDYLTEDAVCCVEWPERAPRILEPIDLALSLETQGEARVLHIEAFTSRGVELLSRIGDEA